MENKKMELLTVVLTILADGGFVLQCPVIVDSKEIYLEDVEALEFLQKRNIKWCYCWDMEINKYKEKSHMFPQHYLFFFITILVTLLSVFKGCFAAL